MCKCNQGGSRVDKVGVSMLSMARSYLILARKQKQAAEIARDYAENGGPSRMLKLAEIHEIRARGARGQARQILRELETRCNRALATSLASSYVSASKLGGWRFSTWKEHRDAFPGDVGGSQDIWQ